MKITIKILALLFVLFTFQSCFIFGNQIDDPEEEPFQQNYEAVTMPRTEFETSTELVPAKTIEEAGKIYVKDNYLFINEPNKGFHIYDNTNPENPINTAFLKVLGSSDLSIKGEVLYMNNATDLIAVVPDFTNNTFEITKRVVNAFPELRAPDGFSYHNTSENEVIVNWTLIN